MADDMIDDPIPAMSADEILEILGWPDDCGYSDGGRLVWLDQEPWTRILAGCLACRCTREST